MTFHHYDIERIQEAMDIILKDLSRHLTINQLAMEVALGKTKLKEGFRVYYGKGVYACLREARMHRAMELVTGTHKSFKSIARECGFKYYNNFIAAFSKQFGRTPGQVRKEAFPGLNQ